jgi:ethanolamine transporter EutH
LLYAFILHLIAGLLTGSLFKVKTLLLLLICVAAELIGAAYLHSSYFAIGVLANIVAIQVGYAGGLVARLTVARSLDRTAKAGTHRAP